jgi:hypothetical protein
MEIGIRHYASQLKKLSIREYLQSFKSFRHLILF